MPEIEEIDASSFSISYRVPSRTIIGTIVDAAERSPTGPQGDSMIRSSNTHIFRSRGDLQVLFCLLSLLAPMAHGLQSSSKHSSTAEEHPAKAEKTAYDYTLPGPNGKIVPLASFKGTYLLIVNLARSSSYNTQLPALIKLNER